MADTVVTQVIAIAAPPTVVWAMLIDPVQSKLWRNAELETDWRPGSPIRITAEIGNKRYRDTLPVLRDLIEGRPNAALTSASSRKI